MSMVHSTRPVWKKGIPGHAFQKSHVAKNHREIKNIERPWSERSEVAGHGGGLVEGWTLNQLVNESTGQLERRVNGSNESPLYSERSEPGGVGRTAQGSGKILGAFYRSTM